eukprot:CAMPEP_0114566162 /NCGR_PEP_ID=MMETSP0114-20121206/14734_1 /TAXON_ID=31324 /ORGANISM="Goniomonas sp, Strain m" /LENGTH=44 /DNA_ID= /DNA_START= /DNA_END= /DNA_ORIENTATION=
MIAQVFQLANLFGLLKSLNTWSPMYKVLEPVRAEPVSKLWGKAS